MLSITGSQKLGCRAVGNLKTRDMHVSEHGRLICVTFKMTTPKIQLGKPGIANKMGSGELPGFVRGTHE